MFLFYQKTPFGGCLLNCTPYYTPKPKLSQIQKTAHFALAKWAV